MIIAISNQKGGVGKTTTAVNIAGGLALQGYKTLLIDVDPQASATTWVLSKEPKDTIKQVFNGKASIKDTMIKCRPNLYILPSSPRLEDLVQQGISSPYILKTALKKLESLERKMDFIIIDTPPNLSLLSQNAWSASHYIIIPVQPEALGLRGLIQFMETVNMIKKTVNPRIERCILPTMYDARKRQHNKFLTILQNLQYPVFKTTIRTSSRLSEAPSEHLVIQDYDKDGKGAEDYNSLIQEILRESAQ